LNLQQLDSSFIGIPHKDTVSTGVRNICIPFDYSSVFEFVSCLVAIKAKFVINKRGKWAAQS